MEGEQAEAVRPSCKQKNRMNNLMKKLTELITLCGTEGFILYSSSSGLKSWPEDPIAVLHLILRFRGLPKRGIRIRRRKQIQKPAWSDLISHEDDKTILGRILHSMYGHDKLDCLTVQQLTEVMELIKHLQSELEEKEREEISSVEKGSGLLDLLGMGERESGEAMEELGEREEKKSCLLIMEGEDQLEPLEVRNEVANSSRLDERRWKEIEDTKARGEEVGLLSGEDIHSMNLAAKFACKGGEERVEGSCMEERPPNLDLSLNFNH